MLCSGQYDPYELYYVILILLGYIILLAFKQYIPSKPAKYGIKIWTLCDSKTSYFLKGQIYTGKETGAKPEKMQGMRVVADLTNALIGQNITIDNFFTSYNLGQLLIQRKLTMLGTVRKNKPELPLFTNTEVHSTSFYFTGDTAVLNYVPKKYKSVVLMSTLHPEKAISFRDDKKPQMILDYNATKGAVDTLDQLVATYSCKRKSNRWPMIIFYNIIDISAYNAFILWTSVDEKWNSNKLYKRRIFLEQLGYSLIEPHIASRTYMPRTDESRKTVNCIQTQYKKSRDDVTDIHTVEARVPKRARCRFCEPKNDNKTNVLCSVCMKHICKFHVYYYCPDCKQ